MQALAMARTTACSNDVEAWRQRVGGLCGRYQALHDSGTMQWAIEGDSGLAPATCLRMITNCSQMYRTQADVRADGHDFYFLVLQLDGLALMGQGDRCARLEPGDVMLIDSARTSRFHFGIENTVSDQLSLIVPRDRLSRAFEGRAVNTAQVIRAGSFTASTLASLVIQLYGATAPSAGHHDAFLDAVLCLLRPDLGGDRLAEPRLGRPGHDRLLTRAMSLIDEALQDPALKPAQIAERMGTSVRNLHRIFARCGSTPARYIMDRRLQRCAQRLEQDVAQAISTIALDCGFNDLSHFSKAFRQRYGMTPRSFRNHRVHG